RVSLPPASPAPRAALAPAAALPDLDDHVLPVRRVAFHERKRELVLQPLELALELRRHRRKIRIVTCGLEVLPRLPPLVRESLRRLELLQTTTRFGGLTVVVVDLGIGQALPRFRVGTVQFVDEAVDRHRRRLALGYASDAATVISGTAASAFDTGQFSTAVWAAWRNAGSSMPGTTAWTVRALFVMPVPGTNVTVASTSSF